MADDRAIREAGEALNPLQQRLQRLIADYANSAGEDLHFAPIQADENLLAELVALAQEGDLAVREHADVFLRSSLYEPPFWYELFLLVRNAVLSSNAREAADPLILEQLTRSLVAIAEFTQQMPGNDIWKRNREALGNTLISFDHLDLETVALQASKSSPPEVQEFVRETVRTVELVRYKRAPASPPPLSRDRKQTREDFNTNVAHHLAAKVAVTTTPFENDSKLSTRFAYFANTQEFVVVGGAQEKTDTDRAVVYGLQHRKDRELVLILPERFVLPTLNRAAWLKPQLPLRIFSHKGGAVLEQVQPARSQVTSAIKARDSFVTRVHHLGARVNWMEPLTRWAGAHPELDPAHRPDNRSWHCRGLRVLKLSNTMSGVTVVAGIDWSVSSLRTSGERTRALRKSFDGPISDTDLEQLQGKIDEAVSARVKGIKHEPDEHWLQSVLRRRPSLIGIEVPAFRELPALRCVGSDAAGGASYHRGFIDLVGVDPQGTIRIVETKLGAFDMLVLQGLDYLMWCEAHKAELCSKLGASELAPFAIHYVISGKADSPPQVSTYTRAQVDVLADDLLWRFHTIENWFDTDNPIAHELPAGLIPASGKPEAEVDKGSV